MSQPLSDVLAYYASQGVMTDPGVYAHLLDGLPESIPGLCAVVQGLLIHPFATRLYEVDLTSVQSKEVNIRPVAEMLRRIASLDDRPLDVARPAGERLVGNCRDHATLFCALLRHQGVPARVRVGFATYFGPRLNYDHWVTEYWQADQERWVLVDPQIDEIQREANKITFDPTDMPPDVFFAAAQAWRLCRAGQRRSGDFGHSSKLHGYPYIRSSMTQELAALNKVEVLPWDVWWELGLKKEEAVTADEKRLLDYLAEVMAGVDGRFPEVRAAFEEDVQFSSPVKSKLRLLGLTTEAALATDMALRPAESSALPVQVRQLRVAGPSGGVKASPNGLLTSLSTPLDPAMIVVRGAQQHNLKHIDVTIPRYKLVVLTGVSGSGKSSLAFDTLYAEGQRRYVESLSAYVRRYLDQMDKPKVEYVGGLSPAIAIEQKSISKNPRSTVATVTEVMDYLRVLFSRAGTQYCPNCGRAIELLGVQQIADRLNAMPAGTRFELLAPVTYGRHISPESLLADARSKGFTRARIDGKSMDLLDKRRLHLEKGSKPKIELVVDRLKIPEAESHEGGFLEFAARLVDSVETTLRAGKGILMVALEDGQEVLLSEANACPRCEISLPKLTASLFSFNSPSGMCPECNGLGSRLEVDPGLIVEHPELSLLDGASRWYGNLRKKGGKHWLGNLRTMATHYGVDLELPWKDLPRSFRDVILYGSGEEKLLFTYEGGRDDSTWRGESLQTVKGVVYHVNRLFRQTKSEGTRRYYASFMSQQPCPSCKGTRLCAEARFVTVGGKTFPEVLSMTVEQAHAWVDGLYRSHNGNGASAQLTGEQVEVVGEVLKELRDRLRFMLNVGLHYLTLNRPAPTLSGGEGQRIRLASQLGCGLVGVLYILDEPSIGLHPRDQSNLLNMLLQLRDMGNTVLVVEHDAETMRTADWVIDLGPGAGVLGGEVVAAGTPAQLAANPGSLTGRYLSGALSVVAPSDGRRTPNGWLTLYGASLFNLKSVQASFPLGVFSCVTGVSGSGKSSLVAETLYPALQRLLHGAQAIPGPYDRIEGLELVDKVINITQEPIGRTPRSNPATYTGVFDEIRRVFASTVEARTRGYHADRFSFNVKGGRCEACQGHGQKKIEMHFLPDVWVTCQECKGTRYNRHTLEIHYKGKNIAEVLDMEVKEALSFFGSYPAIARVLQTLQDVGLDYIKLGQSATTLSGGEAQRVKLAKELSRAATGRTVYILDEPTTGLHFADIQRLLDVLHRLTAAGNTVVVIEHNPDVIKNADWILDLGPEGGEQGGYILAQGTPEEVAEVEASHTGRFLKSLFAQVDAHL